MKRLGKKPPGGSTTLSYLSSSDWVTIPKSKIGPGDIAVNSSHMAVITGSNGAVGQQNPRRNVNVGTISDIMAGSGPYIFRRYKGGSNVEFVGFSGDNMGIQQAGLSDVLEWPGKMVDAFGWLTDSKNWFRIGLVLGGTALIWITIVGIGKAKVGGLLGQTAQKTGKTAAKAVKEVGKKVTKNAKTGSAGK